MLISTFVMLFGYMSSAVITMFLIYILSEMDLRRSIFFHEAYAVKSFVVAKIRNEKCSAE